MKIKKLSSLLLALIMIFSLSANIAYAEEELSFKTPKELPLAVVGSTYIANVEAQGGTPPYTYTCAAIPDGLTFDNGTISGIPTVGGTGIRYYIDVVATDADGNSVSQKFDLFIEGILVTFDVTDNVYTFDGKPHKATIVTKVNGVVTTDIDYTVTYGGEPTQTASGMYPIEITINTPGYVKNIVTASSLEINQSDSIMINFSTSSYVYNGSPQGPTAEVKGAYAKEGTDPVEYEWKDLQHVLVYEGLNVDYNSEDGVAPTRPGRYFVACHVTEPGFAPYPQNHTTEYEISKAKVNFNLQGQDLPYNQGDEWTGVYSPTVAGVSATVKYIKDGIEYDAPQSAGTYTVSITLNNDDDNELYDVGEITPSSITVGKQTVHFSATKPSAEYNDVDYSAEVTNDAGLTEGTDYEVVYYNADGEAVTPHNAGTYTFDVNFLNGKGEQYEKAEITDNTFTITKKPVTFTISPNGFLYSEDGDGQPVPVDITIKTNPAGFTGYTVQYEDDNSKELFDTISAKGRYNVKYTITDSNYRKGTPSTNVVTIGTERVNFILSNDTYPYDKQPKSITVDATSEHGITIEQGKDFTVEYTQDDEEVESPTNAGVYGVDIHLEPSYTVGTVTPETPTLTITARPVTFTAENATYTFDGKPHQATVKTDDTVITLDEYKVQYRDSKGVLSESVTKSGSYDIVVTLRDPKNKNYIITSPTDKLIINENIHMALGNSPAAMIYKDSNHSDLTVEANVQWRENTFNALKNNRKFSGENVPKNCVADIMYSKSNSIVDFDIDEYTVIVNKITDFVDPGFMIDDKVLYKDTPVKVDGVDNLYTVSYEYKGETYTRYIVTLRKIGDVNGDGTVNATDANVLDHITNDSPETLTQMRVWDVNKDGKIDGSDASAIRNRFKTKLVPYYPWI